MVLSANSEYDRQNHLTNSYLLNDRFPIQLRNASI